MSEESQQAIHFAKQGLHVTVVEKNERPGGRCDRFNRDGHHFDTGPTLFVTPQLYKTDFRALGTSKREQFNLQCVEPTYHLVFDDGRQLNESVRAYHRILKLACTIADLAGSEDIQSAHFAEALLYKPKRMMG